MRRRSRSSINSAHRPRLPSSCSYCSCCQTTTIRLFHSLCNQHRPHWVGGALSFHYHHNLLRCVYVLRGERKRSKRQTKTPKLIYRSLLAAVQEEAEAKASGGNKINIYIKKKEEEAENCCGPQLDHFEPSTSSCWCFRVDERGIECRHEWKMNKEEKRNEGNRQK